METGRKILLLLLIVLFITIPARLFMNKNSNNNTTATLELYYLNENSTSINAVKKDFSYDNSEELPELVLDALTKNPQDTKSKHVINKGTKWDITTSPSGLLVDFSNEFLTDDTSRNLFATYAVVKSLCRIDTVHAVKVTVDGNDITAPDSTPIDYLSDKDINLESDTHTSENKVLRLYFATEDQRLFPEYRTVKLSDTVAIEQYIVSELIKGPTDEGLFPTITSDTKVLSAESADGTAYINMSQSFIDKNQGTSDKEQRAVYSIVNSVCDVTGVNDVQILIEGKKVEGFSNVNLTEPIHYNQAINKEQ